MILDPGELSRGALRRLTPGLIVPRPIAFVSTAVADGIQDIAPSSCFVPLTSKPPRGGVDRARLGLGGDRRA